MSTAVTDTTPVPPASTRRLTRYVVPLAAAAAVAALATGPLWWGSGPTGAGDAGVSADGDTVVASPDPTQQPTPDGAYLPVLGAPSWTVADASTEPGYGDVEFNSGDAELEVRWKPADLYAEYVADRESINEPSSPGDPVEVAGLAGQLWAYGEDDFTVVLEPDGDHFLELRGEGLGEAAYLELIGQLRFVGLEEFEASLPDEFVTTAEKSRVVSEISDGISSELGALGLTPDGVTTDLGSDVIDRYDLGSRISSAVACAWLTSYVTAQREGDDSTAADAVAAMATARDWPILQELAEQGGFPDLIWQYADAIAAGEAPTGYRQALDCR